MSFSLLLGLGAALGLLQIYRHNPLKDSTRWVDGGLFVMVGALLGARLAFVLLHYSYYEEHLLETLQLWQGGLSVYGALIGGLLVAGILAVAWKQCFLMVCDRLVPMIPPLAIFIWLGCWQTGVAYGNLAPETAWWGLPTLDESGTMSDRVPLQIMAAMVLLIYYCVLELHPPAFLLPGMKSIVYFAGLAVVLMASSLLRADAAPMAAGLRLDSWAALVFMLLVFVEALYASLPRPATSTEIIKK